MSELKEHIFSDIDEVFPNGYCGPLPSHEARHYYLKSEADKVIADLEESHKMEVGQLLMEIVKLKEERRWRKFSEEKPKEKQWILVFVENPSEYGTYIELRRWDTTCKFDVEDQELYTKWKPLPSAPKDEK